MAAVYVGSLHPTKQAACFFIKRPNLKPPPRVFTRLTREFFKRGILLMELIKRISVKTQFGNSCVVKRPSRVLGLSLSHIS